MTGLYFLLDGESSKGYFKVNKIRRPVLPALEDITEKIIGRPGVINYGQQMGIRQIEIDIFFESENIVYLRKKIENAAKFLYSSETRRLQLSDELDRVYNARLSGNTDFDQKNRYGFSTLTFVCFDPFKYAVNPTVVTVPNILNGEVVRITNPGDWPVNPIVTIRNTKPVSNWCTNSGFENNTSGWIFQATGASSGSLVRDTNIFYAGVASGRLIKMNTTADIPRCYFLVSGYEPGKTYHFEAYVRSEVADGLQVYAEEEDPVNWKYTRVSDVVKSGTAGEWKKISFTVSPQVDDGNVYIHFEATVAAAYNSWIDEVRFQDEINTIVNPKLSLSDKMIGYEGELENGDELVFNFKNWTVFLNGKNAIQNMVGLPFELPSGDNEIIFTSDQGEAELEVSLIGRWI